MIVKDRVALSINLRLRYDIYVHRFRQVNWHRQFCGSRRNCYFNELDAIKITIAAVAELDRNGTVESVQPLNLHTVRVNGSSVGVLISFVTKQSKNGRVLHSEIKRFTVAGSNTRSVEIVA